MLDKLAIIVLGQPNSGKTTTLRAYSDYYHKPVSTFKKGFRYGISPFKPKFWAIKSFIYFLPSSPTESGIPLEDTIEPLGWYPDILLMAEQIGGRQYSNTIHYLRKNEYLIKEFIIADQVGDDVWERWNNGDTLKQEGKVVYRREEVADFIRRFLISKTTI